MNSSLPPAGYSLAESAVAGIEVYKPTPTETPQAEVLEFKCPQCGQTTAYSVAEGGLTCKYCGYYEAPKSKTVGRKAQEFEFKVETIERAAQGWGLDRKMLDCQRCGAQVTVPPEALTVTCPFCGSNKVVQRKASQDVLRPRVLIPFKLDGEACRKIASTWLGSSWMTPAGLAQAAVTGEFSPVFIPYWTFDSVCSADWKAEVGHTETERYYEGGEWKTRTKTVWRWESGRVRQVFDDLLVNGAGKLSRVLLEGIQDYDLHELVDYEARFLAGLQAQAYDIPLESAWETARQAMREQTRQACLSQTSTDNVRNFSMNLDFANESWRYILLPVYVAAYQYNYQNYQILINGQTGSIAGQRPVDWQKVWLVILVLLAPGVLLGLAGLVTLPLAGFGVILAGLGFFLLMLGLIGAFVIYTKAQGLDDA